MRSLSRCLAVAAVVFTAAGCGDGEKSKVTGSVTYNGKPVDDGYILFRPVDGKGSDAGGPIVGGTYTLSAVPVGPKVVVISSNTSPTESGGPMTSEQASKQKVAPKKAGDVTIAPDAKGNNAKVEIKAGGQTLDFALKSTS